MKSFKRAFILFLFVCCILSGTINAQNKSEIDPIVSESFIEDDLLVALDTLSSITGVNITYESSIAGIVTCKLENVSLSKALEIILAATPYKINKRDGYYVITEPMFPGERCLITGSIGIADVKIEGFPGEVFTDANGNYTASIEKGFSGKIQPVKEGYKFNPSYVIYNNIRLERATQDFKATAVSLDQANEKELKDPLVTEEFFGDDLRVVLEYLVEETEIDIKYDKSIEAIVICKFNRTPLSKVLEVIFSATPYVIERVDDSYHIYDQKQFKVSDSVPKEVWGIPGPVVSNSFFDEDLLAVLDLISFDTGINIMCGRTVQGVVNCKLENIPVDKALEIVLAATPYTAVKRDDYYVVRESVSSDKQYQVSGKVGIAKVKMEGFPGEVYTDENGYYMAKVQEGFSGKIQPVKEGYQFNPSFVIYNNISSNRSKQNYAAKEISSNQKVEKKLEDPIVTEEFMNEELPIAFDVFASRSGLNIMYDDFLRVLVSCRLHGIPLSKAMEIVCSSTEYVVKRMDDYYLVISPAMDDLKNKVIEQITISGNVEIPNVVMNGLPGNPVSDKNGSYSIQVESGWSGSVIPVKEGYSFEPYVRTYGRIHSNHNNQDYSVQAKMVKIIDVIEFSEGRPIPGVSIVANPGDIKTVTNNKGQFSIQVPYGWSGKITLSKPGIQFSPDSKSYENVTSDIINDKIEQESEVIEPVKQKTDNIKSKADIPVSKKIIAIPSGDVTLKDITQTKEDVLVMTEILDERFREPRMIDGVVRDFGDFFGRDNQQTHATYIHGYGVIFVMEVDNQFSALTQTQEEVKAPADSDIDLTWEKTRNKVLSLPENENNESLFYGGEYEQQMADILDTELLMTLKYASNIRNIKPGEWIILSIVQSESSVMTIRVKKLDVDVFANGNIDLEKFQERVQILVH